MQDLLNMGTGIIAWVGIAVCITQSAIFSGLNLAFFSMSRLQLEVEAKQGSRAAKIILTAREDANFLLATILWGNVSINVLLTLLSDSVLAGVYSFLFSTIIITFLGEIIPQAYFSRNALKMASMLTPVIRFYQTILYPVARPTAVMLDGWLGKEGITYFREEALKAIIKAHADAHETEVVHVEGVGALNFLEIDKVTVTEEGESLDPKSIIQLPCKLDLPIIPEQGTDAGKIFSNQVNASGHKWIVLADQHNRPQLVLDSDGYLRSLLFEDKQTDPYLFCHRPVVLNNAEFTLGSALFELKKAADFENLSTDVLNHDVILVWTDESQRVITGADILGRLLRGIGDKVH
jgi:metal transporter CNNM